MLRIRTILVSFIIVLLANSSITCQELFSSTFNNDTIFEKDSILEKLKKATFLDSSDISFPHNMDSNSDKTNLTSAASYEIPNENIEEPINYNSIDSFWMDVPNKVIHLYGNAEVKYEDVTLKAAYIQYNWEKGEAWAFGLKDSSGNISGKPEFTESGSFYIADELKYNFKTKKGKSKGLVTKQSEGFLHGTEVKSFGEDYFYSKKAKYTTCDYEHPHFYIEVAKAKVVKDKVIVGKPANLVIADTRTPIILPLGVFPLRKNRTSGFILPEYGRSDELGFFFTGMGYYWAINDYMDLTTTFDIYTRGNWGMDLRYKYLKKYRYSTDLSVDFNTTRTGERQDPNATAPTRDFNVRWTMRIDPKRLHNSNFSANINFVTRAYQQNNLIDTDIERFIDNRYSSSISYRKRWPGKLPSLSIDASHNQNTQTHAVTIRAPSLTFNVGSFTPFKRKVQTGGVRWYEKVNLSYNLRMENRLETLDSLLREPETYRDMKNGIQQTGSVNLPFTLFKHFNFNWRFNHTENWYAKTLERVYVEDTVIDAGDTTITGDAIDTDVFGFKAARNFSLSLNLNWSLYGTWNFKRTKNVLAIRHIVRPRLSLSFTPDFGKERWGYYRTVQSNTTGAEETYSIFANTIFGGPGRGLRANIGFGISNKLEMKVRAKRDTVKGYKKINIFDNFSLSGSYNIAGDSLTDKMSRISFSANNARIIENDFFNAGLNFSGTLDPIYINPSTNSRENKWRFSENRRFFRLTDFRFSVNGGFSSKRRVSTGTARSLLPGRNNSSSVVPSVIIERDPVFGYTTGYLDFDIPWSLRFSHTLSLRKFYQDGRDTTIISANNIRITQFDFNLTPKWKINVRGLGYDFIRKEFNSFTIGIARDLHCWQMAFNVTPIGTRRQFSFTINVRSQVLKDLKYSRDKYWYDFE